VATETPASAAMSLMTMRDPCAFPSVVLFNVNAEPPAFVPE